LTDEEEEAIGSVFWVKGFAVCDVEKDMSVWT